jgi:hypothetical protein
VKVQHSLKGFMSSGMCRYVAGLVLPTFPKKPVPLKTSENKYPMRPESEFSHTAVQTSNLALFILNG